MSGWNLIWIIPICLVAGVALAAAQWRMMFWLGRDNAQGLDRWMERVIPGITGKR
jgi:hypothetical protein